MSLSCIAHVKRNSNNDGGPNRPPAPPIASFIGSTWDRSGSMQDMNGTPGPALYDWVKDACDQARVLNQDCYLSVTTFDDKSEKKIENTMKTLSELSQNADQIPSNSEMIAKMKGKAPVILKFIRSSSVFIFLP